MLIKIDSNSIDFTAFCDQYELPGKFYDILSFVKSALKLEKKLKVVIIIDEFISSSGSEKERKDLLFDLFGILDDQYKHSDFLESVDLIISSLEISEIKVAETESSRGFELISLPSLRNSIKLFSKYKEPEYAHVADYLDYLVKKGD